MTTTAADWEAAWEEYILAEADVRQSFARRHDRGHRLAFLRACKRRRIAIAALRRIDADWCDRQGIA